MRHGHAADAMERIALAAAERDGVGVLLPHGVEGDGVLDLLREGRAGEVGRDVRGVALAPTEEGVARVDRDGLGQRGRQTVGLGRGHAGKSVIRDRYINGRVTAVEDGILSDRTSGKVERSTVVHIRIPLTVPIVAGLVRGARRVQRSVVLNALRCHLLAVKNVGHGMELDRGHIDRYGLIGLDVLDLVGTGGRGQPLAVRIHAFDGVAGARRHGEGHSAVIVHGRDLFVGRARRNSERRVEALARREGDGEGLLGQRIN